MQALEPRLQLSRAAALPPVAGLNHTTATLSLARDDMATVRVGTLALFAGGDAHVAATDIVDIYNSRSGVWSTGKLSQAREDLAGTAVGRLALFAGGTSDVFRTASDVVDIYDSRNARWSTTKLPRACFGMGALGVGTKAIFYGGSWFPRPNFSTGNNDVFIYDTQTGRWSNAPFLAGAGTAVIGNKALIDQGAGVMLTYDGTTGLYSKTTIPDIGGFANATVVGTRAVFEGEDKSGGGIAAVFDS
jgi:hypothetical protein